MNVFDEEWGPLASQDEAGRLRVLAEAGLTLDEVRAWERLKAGAVN